MSAIPTECHNDFALFGNEQKDLGQKNELNHVPCGTTAENSIGDSAELVDTKDGGSPEQKHEVKDGAGNEVKAARAWEDPQSPDTIFVASQYSDTVMTVEVKTPHALGSQATIYRCVNKSELLACKMPRTDSQAMLQTSLREVKVIEQFRHRHLLRYCTHFMYNNLINIILSPLASCSLQDLLSKVQDPDSDCTLEAWFTNVLDASKPSGDNLQDTWQLRLWLRRQASCLADALSYLHGIKIRHGDIRPDNIVVSASGLIFCDFGDALDHKLLPFPHDDKAMTDRFSGDVFTLGAVFLQMFSAFDMILVKESWKLRHVINPELTYHANYLQARPKLEKWIEAMEKEVSTDGCTLKSDSVAQEQLVRWLHASHDMIFSGDLSAAEVVVLLK